MRVEGLSTRLERRPSLENKAEVCVMIQGEQVHAQEGGVNQLEGDKLVRLGGLSAVEGAKLDK